MRKFIRHPTTVPISYTLGGRITTAEDELKNISHGGLCFLSVRPVDPGSIIHLSIPVGHPPFEADAFVVYSNPAPGGYEIGVSFHDVKDEFCIRMVEQVCRIEMYRQEARDKEGRHLSGKEAALEWIEKNAHDFPQ